MDTKEKHFELTDEFITTESGVKLHRIRCTRAVMDVCREVLTEAVFEEVKRLTAQS
jgi:hypothetical protein